MTVLEPTTPSEIPPELVDHQRYRVLGHLGAGGMGVVYKAEHLMMGRTVAVKVIAQRFTANAVAVERFHREVRAAAKLHHPNIVTAYDADEAGGRHFLVMEYVEGVSLDRVVNRRGPLPVATACHVVRLAALGLQHAHSKGMVHRDIKPHNVMVNRKSQVKVLDFGLARLVTEGDLPAGGPDGSHPASGTGTQPGATGTHHAGVTGTNVIVGTPDYISPEQAKAAPLDHRSDLYSLGCLFYFALTGRAPFAAATTAYAKVSAHVLETPPPVADYRADVPPVVTAVLEKMMAKDPADRFASAAEVASALLSFAKASSTPSIAVAAPRRETVPVEDFGFVDDPTNFPAETLADRPAARHLRGWPHVLSLSALTAATLLLVLVLISLQNPGKRGAPAVAPVTPPKAVPAPPAVRVLFVLPKRGLDLDDYEPVRVRLTELGAKVTTAAHKRGPCEPTGCDTRPAVIAELALAEVRPDDFDAVLFPGQDVNEFLRGDGHTHLDRILKPMNEAKKVIGGICGGQRVLVRFQLLKHRTAAQPDEEGRRSVEKAADVSWIAWRRVVTDGHVVTASGARDAHDFADAVHTAVLAREK